MELSEDGFSPPEDRIMKRKVITNICVIPTALFLLLIGIVHSMVNFSGLRRALVRGGIAARVGGPVLFYSVFAGLLFSFFWLVVFLFLPRRPAGGRPACRVAAAV